MCLLEVFFFMCGSKDGRMNNYNLSCNDIIITRKQNIICVFVNINRVLDFHW